jgi:hypothetical protein
MATYPVSKPIPGAPGLGVASVLGEFDLSLPLEGVAGLPLGYALQVVDRPYFPGTPEFQGQARETALQRVRGKNSQKSQHPSTFVQESHCIMTSQKLEGLQLMLHYEVS